MAWDAASRAMFFLHFSQNLHRSSIECNRKFHEILLIGCMSTERMVTANCAHLILNYVRCWCCAHWLQLRRKAPAPVCASCCTVCLTVQKLIGKFSAINNHLLCRWHIHSLRCMWSFVHRMPQSQLERDRMRTSRSIYNTEFIYLHGSRASLPVNKSASIAIAMQRTWHLSRGLGIRLGTVQRAQNHLTIYRCNLSRTTGRKMCVFFHVFTCILNGRARESWRGYWVEFSDRQLIEIAYYWNFHFFYCCYSSVTICDSRQKTNMIASI